MPEAPLVIKISAHLCLLTAALMLGSVITGCLDADGALSNASRPFLLLVFSAAVGVGLTRRSRFAFHQWIGGVSVMLLVTLIHTASLVGQLIFTQRWFYESPLQFVLAIVTAVLCAWLLRALHTPAVKGWFSAKRPSLPNRLGVGFSIRSLLTITAALAIAFASVPWSDLHFQPRLIIHEVWGNAVGRLTSYTIGVRKHQEDPRMNAVEFVVIETSDGSSLESLVSVRDIGRGRDQTATLTLPSGEEVPLPGEHRLFALHDGELRRSAARVTWPQLRGYIDSNPESPSIEGLLAFEQPTDEE